MKRVLVLFFPVFLSFSVHAQFGGLVNKLKSKVTNKLMGKDSTANAGAGSQGAGGNGQAQTGAGSQGAAGQTGGGGQEMANGQAGGSAQSQGGAQTGAGQAAGSASSQGGTQATGAPQAPKFPVTGTSVKATKIVFGIDSDADWAALLKNAVVQDFISRLRARGVTGTDRQVLGVYMQHPDAYTDVMTAMRNQYGASAGAGLRPMPSMLFSVFFDEYDYLISSDHIRAEFGKPDTAAGQPAFGGTLVQAFAAGAVTLVDINSRQSFAIANYLGILPAAIEDDVTSFQDAFGLTNYFKKYMHAPDVKVQPMGKTSFHGYNANVVRMEIPVAPTVDDQGKRSDALLFLHSLLSGTMDFAGRNYDPSYKLYLETYFSHDLDASIPKSVTGDKTILNVDGFYVGSVLKDEKGNQVICDIQHVEINLQVDAGQFMIPDGYPKMTHEQFHERVQAKLRGQ